MYIHLTESARNQLQRYSLSPEDRIRLVYDAEGCGCAVSGVVSLWIVNSSESDEMCVESNEKSIPIYYLKRHEVFFDDHLRLDYSAERLAYRLSSNGQIYSNSLVVSDRR